MLATRHDVYLDPGCRVQDHQVMIRVKTPFRQSDPRAGIFPGGGEIMFACPWLNLGERVALEAETGNLAWWPEPLAILVSWRQRNPSPFIQVRETNPLRVEEVNQSDESTLSEYHADTDMPTAQERLYRLFAPGRKS